MEETVVLNETNVAALGPLRFKAEDAGRIIALSVANDSDSEPLWSDDWGKEHLVERLLDWWGYLAARMLLEIHIESTQFSDSSFSPRECHLPPREGGTFMLSSREVREAHKGMDTSAENIRDHLDQAGLGKDHGRFGSLLEQAIVDELVRSFSYGAFIPNGCIFSDTLDMLHQVVLPDRDRYELFAVGSLERVVQHADSLRAIGQRSFGR
jgi:hypothetical protein